MISGPLIAPEQAASLVPQAIVLDARAGLGAAESYAEEHVAGALYADLESVLSAEGDPIHGGRHPLPPVERWLRQVGRWGITPSTPVLIYDEGSGGMAAARAWWMLRVIGHEPLAVVDGGWSALCKLGVLTESGVAVAAPSDASYPSELRRWPSVDADFVERVRQNPVWRLIDARAPERYSGSSEPIDPIAGHIPGAHNLYWQSQFDSAGKLADRETLRERFEAVLGEIPPDRAICYCGSGVTACHLLLCMEACGLFGARLYVGSWSEWCRQDRPRASAP